MKQVVKKFRVFGYDITFVIRHRFERETSHTDRILNWMGEYRLGLWYKPSNLVGRRNFKNPDEWKNNMVREHMVGADLILAKSWICISKGAMYIDID